MLQLYVIASKQNNKYTYYMVVIHFYIVWKNYHTRSFQFFYHKNLKSDWKFDAAAMLV
jgi:hypothetical protein